MSFEIKLTSKTNDKVVFDELMKQIEKTMRGFNPSITAIGTYEFTEDKRTDIQIHPVKYIFGSRADAESVVDALRSVIERFGRANVADLMDCVGITSTWDDHRWGWKDLSNVSIIKVDEGYVIRYPDVMRFH